MLEPYAGKLARTVLRGEESDNGFFLPDQETLKSICKLLVEEIMNTPETLDVAEVAALLRAETGNDHAIRSEGRPTWNAHRKIMGLLARRRPRVSKESNSQGHREAAA
jgi:hypothetical protein